VRFYDLIVFRGSSEQSFSVHYRTELDRNNSRARQAEAEEVIKQFENASSCKDARKANASICSTPAQAATKELPEEILQFERGQAGDWRFVGKAELPPRTA
jgi:hypothetical protein